MIKKLKLTKPVTSYLWRVIIHYFLDEVIIHYDFLEHPFKGNTLCLISKKKKRNTLCQEDCESSKKIGARKENGSLVLIER